MEQISTTHLKVYDRILNNIHEDCFRKLGFKQFCNPNDCTILAHIHLLPTTIKMINKIISLGFEPSRIIILPKPYSTVQHCVKDIIELGVSYMEPNFKLFRHGEFDRYFCRSLITACNHGLKIAKENNSKRVVLIDDGGLLTDYWIRMTKNLSKKFVSVSVQQTASGFYKNRFNFDSEYKIPRIDIANSTAKTVFESKIISKGVWRKLETQQKLFDANSRFCIVGYGALGQAITRSLAEKNRYVCFYDRLKFPKRQFTQLNTLKEVFAHSDVIIGATGHNFFQKNISFFNKLEGEKSLLSVSSRDVEFMEILRMYETTQNQSLNHPKLITPRITFSPNENILINIFNSGFPINFDRKEEWETPAEISITRALVIYGLLMAIFIDENSGKMDWHLPFPIQKDLIKMWLNFTGIDHTYFKTEASFIDDNSWWRRHEYHRNSCLRD